MVASPTLWTCNQTGVKQSRDAPSGFRTRQRRNNNFGRVPAKAGSILARAHLMAGNAAESRKALHRAEELGLTLGRVGDH